MSSWRSITDGTSESERNSLNVEGKASDFVEKLLEGELLKKIEQVVERQLSKKASGNLNGENINENGAGCSKTRSITEENGKGSDNLETFDPADRYINIDRWLAKIDQLGETYGWSDWERSYFMQMKLEGAAREWYNRQDSLDLTWSVWKAAISQQFRRNYPALFRELLARVKKPEETITSYYHSKLALCDICEIDGEKAVSMLIDGLPEDMQSSALATYCTTPQEFYSKFLARLGEIQGESTHKKSESESPSHHEKTKITKVDTKREESPGHDNQQKLTDHSSRDCPDPSIERCNFCKSVEHKEINCPKKCTRRKRNRTSERPDKRFVRRLVPRPGGGLKWGWVDTAEMNITKYL